MSAECLVSCLEALEDVDSAATTVKSERCDVANAHLLRLVGVRGGALGDALSAGTTLLKDVTATELAVERVGLDARLVALDLEGSGEASGSDSESKEVLEVHF